jgi:hypothetical protein
VDGPDLLPDFTVRPVWGATIDTADLVDGDFSYVSSRGFLNDQTGLLLAEDSSQAAGAVVAFDLDSREPIWQVNIDKTLVDGSTDTILGDVTRADDRTITVHCISFDDGEIQYPAITLDTSGAVLSKTADLGGEPWGAHRGVLLVWNDQPGAEHLAAYRAEDLSLPVWQADTGPDVLNTSAYNDWTSSWWIAPDSDVIDVYTGEPTGLSGDWGYWLANGPVDLALHWEDNDGPVRLVDPETGEPMWDSSAPVATGRVTNEVRGQTLLVGPPYSERSAHVWARDVQTGRVLWTGVGRIAAIRGHTALIGRGPTLTARQIRSGRELARTRLPEEYSVLGAGAEVFYIQAWQGERRVLTAFAIDGLKKLWTLDTSPEREEGATSVWYRWTEDRLFAVFSLEDRQIMRELAPV